MQQEPAPTADDLADGELLCETLAFVIAAGQRAGLQGSASYAGAPVTDIVMGGSAVARVVASKADSIPVGAIVSSNGWQRFTVQPAKAVTMFEDGTSTDGLDPVHHIGVLGGNGLTAYFGFYEIGKPKAGETVLVSGAAGSVGHLVCQCAPPLCSRTCCTGAEIMWWWCCRLAKDMGCRVVGIAGSDDKCELLKEDLGVDETVNYK